MARITTYTLDSNISLNDKLVGTDADDNSITKNYSIDTLGNGLISLKNIITGGGTLRQIPMFTPNGKAIGNSLMFQKPNDLEIQVGVIGSGSETILGAGFISTTGLGVTNISAQEGGEVTFNGNVVIGDGLGLPDYLTISSSVQDANAAIGTEGQILVANPDSRLIWTDNFVLTSPGGTQYRIVVDNAGVLSTVAV